MSFICETCGAETNKLIAPGVKGSSKLACPKCFVSRKNSLCDLGQTRDRWVGQDGKGHRITAGKQWEMEHRRTDPLTKQVYNSWTKRETSY